MTLDEWLQAVCSELGVEVPDIRAVLDLTRDVAHRIERPAAPITALLIGLASRNAEDVTTAVDQVHTLLINHAPG